MTAYVIARVDVTDADKWMEYAAAAGPTVADHGGKYLARGGASEGLENWEAAKAKREGAGYMRMTLVEGYDG